MFEGQRNSSRSQDENVPFWLLAFDALYEARRAERG